MDSFWWIPVAKQMKRPLPSSKSRSASYTRRIDDCSKHADNVPDTLTGVAREAISGSVLSFLAKPKFFFEGVHALLFEVGRKIHRPKSVHACLICLEHAIQVAPIELNKLWGSRFNMSLNRFICPPCECNYWNLTVVHTNDMTYPP